MDWNEAIGGGVNRRDCGVVLKGLWIIIPVGDCESVDELSDWDDPVIVLHYHSIVVISLIQYYHTSIWWWWCCWASLGFCLFCHHRRTSVRSSVESIFWISVIPNPTLRALGTSRYIGSRNRNSTALCFAKIFDVDSLILQLSLRTTQQQHSLSLTTNSNPINFQRCHHCAMWWTKWEYVNSVWNIWHEPSSSLCSKCCRQ